MIEEKEAVVDNQEEDDDKVSLIPKHQRTEEEEEKVRHYMSSIDEVLSDIGMKPFPINKKKRTRVKMPSFKTDKEQRIWENTEMDRCEFGHNGMSGKMYFFFNYGWMKNLSKGKFAPEYRVCDDEWFKTMHETKKTVGYGIVCIKRRRVGASWKESADALHDSIFTPFFITGMNSKSVVDSQILFAKVKFMFDNLPKFLRIRVRSKTKMFMDFSYDVKDGDNIVKRGTQSEIIVVAPTESAFEGHMLNKWICDEAGKQPDLPQMWSFTEDTMMEETKRLGMPVLFGTSGDIGNTGKGLKEMWDNAEIYRLKRFFFVGYMGLAVDEFGNDTREDTIRWIIYERKRRKKLSSKLYHDFLQRYPLTVKEAFAQTSSGGLGDLVKVSNQVDALTATPVKATKGYMKIGSDAKPKFVPKDFGDIIIYEHAKTGLDDAYIAGVDPTDHDDTFDEASDQSTYIIKKAHGTTPAKIVASYTASPKMASDYYEQTMLLLQYYNDCKALIERNRFRMIAFFEESGKKHLLATTPQGVVKLIGGKSYAIGMMMGGAGKEYLEGLVTDYVDHYCQWIPDIDLLDEIREYGTRNTDRVMGFGLALILSKEDRLAITKSGEYDISIPRFKYIRDKNGNPKLVNY